MMSDTSLKDYLKEEVGVESFGFSPSGFLETDTSYDTDTKELKRGGRRTKRLCVKRTYGLRPRNQMRRPSYEDGETAGGGGGGDNGKLEVKKRDSRSKTKSSTSAKFRRLTANARERQRMKEINNAFNTLQSILPALHGRHHKAASTTPQASKCSMTKIRTLRQAASYIKALSELLSSDSPLSDPLIKDPHHSSYRICESESFNAPTENLRLNVRVTASCELHNASPATSSKCPALSFAEPTFSLSYQDVPQQHQHPPHSTMAPSLLKGEPFEDAQSNDEELFSLLEKEVLSIRNAQMLSENCSYYGELNWNDELISLGCN